MDNTEEDDEENDDYVAAALLVGNCKPIFRSDDEEKGENENWSNLQHVQCCQLP